MGANGKESVNDEGTDVTCTLKTPLNIGVNWNVPADEWVFDTRVEERDLRF